MHDFIEQYRSVLPEKIFKVLKTVPEDIKQKSEIDLRQDINPNKTLYSLKESFWKELEKAQYQDRLMNNTNIFKNICSRAYFYKKVLATPKWMAWICSPSQNFEDQMNALVFKSTDRLEELLSINIVDQKTGSIDHNKGSLLLKTIAEVTNRAKGQAINSSLNTNVSMIGKLKLSSSKIPMTLKESEEKIKQLKDELGMN